MNILACKNTNLWKISENLHIVQLLDKKLLLFFLILMRETRYIREMVDLSKQFMNAAVNPTGPLKYATFTYVWTDRIE